MRLFVGLAVIVVLLSAARMVGVPTIVQWWQTLPSGARVLYLAGFTYNSPIPARTEPSPKIKPASTRRPSVNRQKSGKPAPVAW